MSMRTRLQARQATRWDLLLPQDLILRVLELITDYTDCAALSLASPRLGLIALRAGLHHFCDPLFAIAMHLQRAKLDEAIVRKYVADAQATVSGVAWLQTVSPNLCICLEYFRDPEVTMWSLCRGGVADARLLRHYHTDGEYMHLAGPVGEERIVRMVFKRRTQFLKGGAMMERLAYVVCKDLGVMITYEGEQGHERMVRMDWSDGSSSLHDGEKGAEALVRHESPDGRVIKFEGQKGQEQAVADYYEEVEEDDDVEEKA